MQDTEYGYCHCGCGEKTQIATMTQTACGWIKGEPKRFVFNHHRRKRIDEYYAVEDLGYTTSCWVWQGNTRDGYGRIFREDRLWNASRWYYVQAKGPIPEGMQLDHLCHQNCAGGLECTHRRCVNPAHLEPVLQQTNIQRGYKTRGRPTHCKRGHEFTPENTIIGGDGAWRCRICDNAKQRRHYYKRAAAAGVQPGQRKGPNP